MPSLLKTVALAAAVSMPIHCIDLDTASPDSIKQASATIANGLMSYYAGNSSNTSSAYIGLFPKPAYWWESGAVWAALIDYYTYTNDSSYNPTVSQALLAQTGPANDYLPPAQTRDLGNDDQAFWALACMDAVESGFPNPPAGQPQWIDLATNVWDRQVLRWDTASCGGGLRWQIFSFNQGYNYKNSASNAALFQLSARLARYTGNATYAQWANKTWDWLRSSDLVTAEGRVFDGTDSISNCTTLDHVEWSYNAGSVLLGASVLYNYTNGSSIWHDRASLVANNIANSFTSNASHILTEVACEAIDNCNVDQIAFKGITARWLAKSSVFAPMIKDQATTILTASAKAAAESCVGGADNMACGYKWTVSGYDGMTGVGEELNALSVVQSLLLLDGSAASSAMSPNTASSNGTMTPGGASPNNTTNGTQPSTIPYKGAGILQASSNLWTVVLASALVLLGHCIMTL